MESEDNKNKSVLHDQKLGNASPSDPPPPGVEPVCNPIEVKKKLKKVTRVKKEKESVSSVGLVSETSTNLTESKSEPVTPAKESAYSEKGKPIPAVGYSPTTYRRRVPYRFPLTQGPRNIVPPSSNYYVPANLRFSRAPMGLQGHPYSAATFVPRISPHPMIPPHQFNMPPPQYPGLYKTDPFYHYPVQASGPCYPLPNAPPPSACPYLGHRPIDYNSEPPYVEAPGSIRSGHENRNSRDSVDSFEELLESYRRKSRKRLDSDSESIEEIIRRDKKRRKKEMMKFRRHRSRSKSRQSSRGRRRSKSHDVSVRSRSKSRDDSIRLSSSKLRDDSIRLSSRSKSRDDSIRLSSRSKSRDDSIRLSSRSKSRDDSIRLSSRSKSRDDSKRLRGRSKSRKSNYRVISPSKLRRSISPKATSNKKSQSRRSRSLSSSRLQQDHPQTQTGLDHFQTRIGLDHLQTRTGLDHLQTRTGLDHLQTRTGLDHLQTRTGQDHFQTRTGQDNFQSRTGLDHFQTRIGLDHFQTRTGLDRFQTRTGLDSSFRASEIENRLPSPEIETERDLLLKRWRRDYCQTAEEVKEKMAQLSKMTPEEIIELEKKVWTRTAPADLYYTRDEKDYRVMHATPRLMALTKRFKEELVLRAKRIIDSRPPYEPPPRKQRLKLAKHKSEVTGVTDSSSDSSDDEEHNTMEEMERKRLHPYRLHQELWFNDPGEMNDGPLCRCSMKAKRFGIRHGIYAGEDHLPPCNPYSNNAGRLFHYRITISPPTNFLTKTPTIIKHDEHEFIFEGFSMFTHYPLQNIPTCKVIRFNIEYTILYIEEKIPENFTVQELDLFYDYLFRELLELVDLDFHAYADKVGCPRFHFMPRFVRDLADNGKEILSMNEVLSYLLDNGGPLIPEKHLDYLLSMSQFKWQNYADDVKGMVVTYPGMKPCSLRVDQLDRERHGEAKDIYPEIVHFGIRPPQLSYAGNPEYQKAWREYVKFRHLLANMPKPSFDDKRKLEGKESNLQEMRTQSKMKRDVTIAVSAKGFHRTGIMCDMVQHAMLIPVLICHLRFHKSCDVLEESMGYNFKNRYLLQLALTHPSYRENFGTNPDHARNTLTNCGIRQPEYGDRRIHYMNTRKRGINTLINIMSRFGEKSETQSNITHNERLEFLGDAVVEFLTSIHLYFMFPELEEGGLATYRAALVQNQHLAVLAKVMRLDEFMLYAHGSDLCHDLELRHAMANCFEAVMGALFLDGGIEVPDKVFAETLLRDKPHIMPVWVDLPKHPLQEQEPLGDRSWIESSTVLKKLTNFEQQIGLTFNHIRLLARAFTDRSIGFTNLTQGSNQRLEFLGDTVLQLIASDYLYKHFPEHHEGHLSLLRSSLVNNRTQAVVCNDLGMAEYAMFSHPKHDLKTKDRADLLEALLGAIYVDKGYECCEVFCKVCFFPRLQHFIMNQDWNDPKSKLQQCCLTLRALDGGEPDIPVYKVVECKGPTNTRIYTVAVYFRRQRLAKASGHSIQMAEMNAAKAALVNSRELFPQLDHQRRVIAKSLKNNRRPFPGMFNQQRKRFNQQGKGNNQQGKGNFKQWKGNVQQGKGNVQQQGKGPVQQGKGPIQQGKGPIQQWKGPLQQGKGPIQQGKGPIQQGKGPIQQGKRPIQQWKGATQQQRKGLLGNGPPTVGNGPFWQNKIFSKPNPAPSLQNKEFNLQNKDYTPQKTEFSQPNKVSPDAKKGSPLKRKKPHRKKVPSQHQTELSLQNTQSSHEQMFSSHKRDPSLQRAESSYHKETPEHQREPSHHKREPSHHRKKDSSHEQKHSSHHKKKAHKRKKSHIKKRPSQ